MTAPATESEIIARHEAALAEGGTAAAEAALDEILSSEPANLTALLLKGQLAADRHDERGATSFFTAAVKLITGGAPMPRAIEQLASQAFDHVETAPQRFEAYLRERLDAAGPVPARVEEALDIMMGRRPLYMPPGPVQQPKMFHFPGLPQRAFYERGEFAWVPEVEAAIPAMQAELRAVQASDFAFDPYLRADPSRPPIASDLVENADWGSFYFWQAGAPVADHAALAPATMAVLAAAPIPVIEQRSPMAHYSLLKPGTHIPPHCGLLNTRLIVHVPLQLQPGCALRVGTETRSWQAGQCLIFDDSFEHEAWNRSSGTRIILLFEIWRPELDEAERDAVRAMLEAINAFGGPAG